MYQSKLLILLLPTDFKIFITIFRYININDKIFLIHSSFGTYNILSFLSNNLDISVKIYK